RGNIRTRWANGANVQDWPRSAGDILPKVSTPGRATLGDVHFQRSPVAIGNLQGVRELLAEGVDTGCEDQVGRRCPSAASDSGLVPQSAWTTHPSVGVHVSQRRTATPQFSWLSVDDGRRSCSCCWPRRLRLLSS